MSKNKSKKRAELFLSVGKEMKSKELVKLGEKYLKKQEKDYYRGKKNISPK